MRVYFFLNQVYNQAFRSAVPVLAIFLKFHITRNPVLKVHTMENLKIITCLFYANANKGKNVKIEHCAYWDGEVQKLPEGA